MEVDKEEVVGSFDIANGEEQEGEDEFIPHVKRTIKQKNERRGRGVGGGGKEKKGGGNENGVKEKKEKKVHLSFDQEDGEESEETFVVKKSKASENFKKGKDKKVIVPIDQEMVQTAMQNQIENQRKYDAQSLSSLNDEKFFRSKDIPDSKTIFELKKKREQLRRQEKEIDEFIPLTKKIQVQEGEEDEEDKYEGRLVREEDELEDDEAFEDHEGDAIYFGSQSLKRFNKQKKEDMKEMIADVETEVDEEKIKWEEELIKRGLSQAPEKLEADYSKAYHISKIPTILPLPQEKNLDGDILQKSLDKLRKEYTESSHQLKMLKIDLENSENSSKQLEEKFQQTSTNYRFYQESKIYFDNLGNCLDEKVPELIKLEDEYHLLLAEETKLVQERRSDLLRDLLEEIEDLLKGTTANFYAASYRASRKKDYSNRRLKRTSESGEGFSTDEEIEDKLIAKRDEDQKKILQASVDLFSDTIDDFKNISVIKSKLEDWKFNFSQTYKDAYVGAILRNIFEPFARMELLSWNPFLQQVKVHEMNWFQVLQTYGERDMVDEDDPDFDLTLKLVEKVVVRKIFETLPRVFDPMSSKQNKILHGLIDQLLQYEIKNSEAFKELIEILQSAFLDEIEQLRAYKQFQIRVGVPEAIWPSIKKYQNRIVWTCLKILQNAFSWTKHFSRKVLQENIFEEVVQEFIIPNLSHSQVGLEEIIICEKLVDFIPKTWIEGYSVPEFFSSIERYIASVYDSKGFQSISETSSDRIIGLFVKIQSFDKASRIAKELKK